MDLLFESFQESGIIVSWTPLPGRTRPNYEQSIRPQTLHWVSMDPSFWSPNVPPQADPKSRSIFRAPKDRIQIGISHSGPRLQYQGIPETMVDRSLLFMWSFGPLIFLFGGLGGKPRERLYHILLQSQYGTRTITLGDLDLQ